MGLNESKGNMYNFISHTWNTVKGKCYHDCSYCYMKRWGKLKPTRFDEKELKTDLGKGNFIFVGSSCDMWAENIHHEWIIKTLEYCNKFDNKYFFQTKNPQKFNNYIKYMPINSDYCVTIETNRVYKDIMGNCPSPRKRVDEIIKLSEIAKNCYITIEPIMDFDLDIFIDMIELCEPIQVNIGADSGGHNLPEPSKEKVLSLISELEKFTVIHEKSNLKKLLCSTT